MVMMEWYSFAYGVIITTIGFLIGIAIKVCKNDILYMLLNLFIKTDDGSKIKDLPVDYNDKK